MSIVDLADRARPASRKRTTYIREDMGLVTIDGDPIAWDSARGGDIVTRPYRRPMIEDLVLERVRRDDGPQALVKLARRVGDRATITVAHLDMDGNPTGRGFRYEGTLVSVHLSPYDANSAKVATDRIVLRPSSLTPIDGGLGLETWRTSLG